MSWNSSGFYEYNRSFSTNAIYGFNVSCNKTGYNTLIANDTANITWKQYITFTSPTPDNDTTAFNYTYINLTISEAGYCLLDWNGTNETMSNATQAETYFVNKTTMPNGNYTFMAWCNDTLGNLNNSETRWVYIDWTDTPNIYFDTPPTPANGTSQTKRKHGHR
jgi:hypothetical protein